MFARNDNRNRCNCGTQYLESTNVNGRCQGGNFCHRKNKKG